MSILNKSTFILIVMILLCVSFTDSFCQIGNAYAASAAQARAAAARTKCPENRTYYLKIANWCDCMAEIGKTGIPKNCGDQPGNAPMCDADNVGGETSVGNTKSSTQSKIQEIKFKQQQLESDLSNAQSASLSAYQNAINTGKKGSGAILDATLAGSQQISDPTYSSIYTGVGLGIALFTHISEKKGEKKQKEELAKQKEEEIRTENERKQLIIETKNKFISDALNINKYDFSDLISKERYATILLVPKNYQPEEQQISFSSPFQIPKYTDDTYPLKVEIERQLLSCLDKATVAEKIVYTLYPITDPEKFISDFVKKMGSGKVINLNAELLNFSKDPFTSDFKQDKEKDFWGNPIKKDERKKQY